VLEVQSFCSLLSNSTYLSLLVEIITTHIEALVATGYKVLYALLIEVGCLGCKPFLNALLQLVIPVKPFTSSKSLQVQEQITVSSFPAPEEIYYW
jgi:hypothetical protein